MDRDKTTGHSHTDPKVIEQENCSLDFNVGDVVYLDDDGLYKLALSSMIEKTSNIQGMVWSFIGDNLFLLKSGPCPMKYRFPFTKDFYNLDMAGRVDENSVNITKIPGNPGDRLYLSEITPGGLQTTEPIFFPVIVGYKTSFGMIYRPDLFKSCTIEESSSSSSSESSSSSSSSESSSSSSSESSSSSSSSSSSITGYEVNVFASIPPVACMASSPAGILYNSTASNTTHSITGSNGSFSRRQAFAIDLITGEVTDWKPGDIGSGFTGGPTIRSMCVGSDGYVYASLEATTPPYGSSQIQGTTFLGICRFHPTTGVVDAGWQFTGHSSVTFNTFQNIQYDVNRISADGAGNIYWCASQYTNGSGQVSNVYVIDESDASIVTTHTCNSVAKQVTFDGLGNYYIGGPFTVIDANTRRNIAKFDSFGNLQPLPAPAATIITDLRSLAYGHGRLYYSGYDASNSAGLAAWDISTNARITGFAPDVNEGTTSLGWQGMHAIPLTVDGIDLVAVVGGFFMVGNALRNAFAVVRASDGALTKTPYDGSLQSISTSNGSDMAYWPDTNAFYIGSTITPGIRRSVVDTDILPDSIPFRAFQVGTASACNRTITIGSKLYCFGGFANVSVDKGSPGYGTIKSTPTHFARGMVCFDLTTGQIDNSFAVGSAGIDAGQIFGAALSQDGTKFHIAGSFTQVHGVARKGIASINVSDGLLDGGWIPDPSDGSVPNPTYASLEAHGGLLFVSRANQESPATGLFKVHVYTDTNPPVFQATHTVNSVSTQIRYAVDGNGKYYFSGIFTSVDGNPRTGIARFNANDTFDSTFNMSVAGSFNSINDMLIDGNRIYAVGSFTSFGGSTRRSIAAWDWSADTLDSFSIQSNATNNFLTLLKHPTGKLIIISSAQISGLDDGNGNFTYKRQGIAAIDSSGYVDTTWFAGSAFTGANSLARLDYDATTNAFIYCGNGGLGGGTMAFMKMFNAEQ